MALRPAAFHTGLYVQCCQLLLMPSRCLCDSFIQSDGKGRRDRHGPKKQTNKKPHVVIRKKVKLFHVNKSVAYLCF